jgi:hypothetical protein
VWLRPTGHHVAVVVAVMVVGTTHVDQFRLGSVPRERQRLVVVVVVVVLSHASVVAVAPPRAFGLVQSTS